MDNFIKLVDYIKHRPMKIELGDKVRHKTDETYNTQVMDVIGVSESQCKCLYYEKQDAAPKEKWFNRNDIQWVSTPEGNILDLLP